MKVEISKDDAEFISFLASFYMNVSMLVNDVKKEKKYSIYKCEKLILDLSSILKKVDK